MGSLTWQEKFMDWLKSLFCRHIYLPETEHFEQCQKCWKIREARSGEGAKK